MSETLLPSAAVSSLVGTAFSSQEFAKVDTVTRKILQTEANTSVISDLRWMVISVQVTFYMLTEIKPRHSC